MRQSNDRYAIVFGISLVVFTFCLIVDVQIGLNLSSGYIPMPKRVDDKVVSTVNVPVQKIQNPESSETEQLSGNETENFDTFARLKQNFGQHWTNIGKLRKYIGSKESPDFNNDLRYIGKIFNLAKDHFDELQDAVDYIEMTNAAPSKSNDTQTLGQILSFQLNETTTILDKFNYEIKQNELYAEDSETIDRLIQEMATRKIVHVDEKEGGTQIKMTMQFDNGMLAVAKPMRFPRDQQTLENHILYADYERHSADIAAFHLDRLLGFRRAFPVTGRIINMTSEIFNICGNKLRNTFFTSLQPYNNLCFYGTCHRYCDIYHPVCGRNGLIEASFIAFYPNYMGAKNQRTRHPWRKAYNPYERPIWERDSQYCQKVSLIIYGTDFMSLFSDKKIKAKPPYNKGRRLFDLIDMAVFDFLTGNMDRHHYEYINLLGEDAFLIHYDNGRGFGRPYYDELTNLAPLVQCCMIRSSTLKTLLRFHNGPKPLSQLMKEKMAGDPVAPVLWEPHFEALDRRVSILLTAVRHCIETHPIHDVIFATHDISK